MGHDSTITVTGSAAVDVEPDIVVADLGVEVRTGDVATALREAEQHLASVRASLSEAGVAAGDLRSGQAWVWREDRADASGALVEVVVHATLGLRATLRDVAAAGEQVHAALVAAGEAARMNNLAFAVSDATAAQARARAAAFDDARAVAQAYASQAGRALGQVQEIVEGSVAPPQPHKARALTADAAASLPIEPGSQAVSASVTVTWLLTD